jgi:hypothetical protein
MRGSGRHERPCTPWSSGVSGVVVSRVRLVGVSHEFGPQSATGVDRFCRNPDVRARAHAPLAFDDEPVGSQGAHGLEVAIPFHAERDQRRATGERDLSGLSQHRREPRPLRDGVGMVGEFERRRVEIGRRRRLFRLGVVDRSPRRIACESSARGRCGFSLACGVTLSSKIEIAKIDNARGKLPGGFLCLSCSDCASPGREPHP